MKSSIHDFCTSRPPLRQELRKHKHVAVLMYAMLQYCNTQPRSQDGSWSNRCSRFFCWLQQLQQRCSINSLMPETDAVSAQEAAATSEEGLDIYHHSSGHVSAHFTFSQTWTPSQLHRCVPPDDENGLCHFGSFPKALATVLDRFKVHRLCSQC
jgi:hypothetical protein